MFCTVQKHESDIVHILNPENACKICKVKSYGLQNGFCSTSLFLNSDSTFLYETGCEGHSQVTMGQWKMMDDSIQLSPIEASKLSLVCTVELLSKTKKDSKTTFFIVDKTGKPIPYFIILPLKKSEKYTYTSNARVVFDSDNKAVDVLETNDKGCVSLDLAQYDSLEFSQLKILTGKSYRFSTANLSGSIKIVLNTNAYGLMSSDLQYNLWNTVRKYKFSKKQLVNKNTSLTEYE